MLPITFSSPATCAATNVDSLDTRFRKDNTLKRRPADVDFLLLPFYVHDTTTMLSLTSSTCLLRKFLVPKIPSNTSHSRSFPEISKSFISKSPPGFVGMTILDRNLFGHSKRQIVVSSASFPGSQPHIIPSPGAST